MNKKGLGALMTYGLMSSEYYSIIDNLKEDGVIIIDDNKENKTYSNKKQKIKKVIPKGCKEYTFDGINVIAISEKSAKKKIERLKKNEREK